MRNHIRKHDLVQVIRGNDAGASPRAPRRDGGGRSPCRSWTSPVLPRLREGDIDLHRTDAVHRLHGAPSLPYEPPGIVRLNAERKADVPGLRDLETLDMPTLHDITAGLGMPYAGQGLEYTPPEISVTHFESLREVLTRATASDPNRRAGRRAAKKRGAPWGGAAWGRRIPPPSK